MALVGAALLFAWDDWFVNFDGSFYMALASRIITGEGYTFPDGSPATFRGPGYPGFVAFAWAFLPDTARTAIWATRAVLVGNAVVVVLLVRRLGGRPSIAALAGLLLMIQPLLLVAGGLYLVPDSLVTLLLLGTLLLLARREGPRVIELIGGGFVLGLAFLVKESALLLAGVPAVWLLGTLGWRDSARVMAPLAIGWGLPVLPWAVYAAANGTWTPLVGVLAIVALALATITAGRVADHLPDIRRPAGRAVLVVGVFALTLMTLRLAGNTPIIGWDELWGALQADLATQLYVGSPWSWSLPALLLAVGWAADRVSDDTAFIGGLLTSSGLAFLLYVVTVGGGLRNAVVLAIGLVLLFAGAVGELWERGRREPVMRLLAVALLLPAAWSSFLAADETAQRLPARQLSAEGTVTTSAAAWIREHAAGETIAVTPLYAQSLWRLSESAFDPLLIPVYIAAPLPNSPFERRLHWAGTVPGSPDGDDRPLTVTVTRTQRAALFADALTAALNRAEIRHLVVSGNAEFPTSAYDAGGLLPALETSPTARAEARFGPSELDPQWIVVYEIDHPFRFDDPPPVVHLATDAAPPSIRSDQVLVDPPAYGALVRGILEEIPHG